MAVENYITAVEAMRLLNCTRGGLSYYVKDGRIKKTGEKYGARFSEADVLRVAESKSKEKRIKRTASKGKRLKFSDTSGLELQRLINKQILRNRQNGRKH